MKNRPSRFLAILLVTVFILGFLPTISAQPPPAPALWIEPAVLDFDTAHTHVGDKFNVTVWGSVASDVFTYQVNVTYDTTMLNVTSVRFTATPTSAWWAGHATVGVRNVDYTRGTVVVGETLLAPDVVSASSGSICNITFTIIVAPTAGHNLTSLIETNHPKSSYLLNPNLNKIAGVTFGHATYTLSGGALPPPTRHQVLLSNVTPSSDHVNQGNLLSLEVVALNNGTVMETFDVNATYDGTLIDEQTVTSLAPGSTHTLTFSWNTTGVTAGDYTITATATPVAGQTDLSNLAKTTEVQVLVPTEKPKSCNLKGYGLVDMLDIGMAARAFMTTPGDSRWNAAADVIGPDGVPDDRVDIIDIAVIAQHFGQLE